MRVLMIGRSKSIAFEELEKYWGEVIFAKPPKIRFEKYDLVVAQEPTPRIGIPAYLAAKLTGAKLVMEVHADYIHSGLSPLQRFIAIHLLKRCDLVRAVSGKIARELEELGIGNVAMIPSIYIKTDIYRPMKPHSEREPIILSIGRLVEQKNFPLLLKAFKILVEEVPEARLIIIGRGPLENKILEYVRRLDLKDSFKLVKRWLSEDDLVKMYNDAAILAITSHYEGGPRVAFEAGACHTPFVSTPVGILAEVAKDGVHGFFAEDVEDFAEKLLKLLKQPELRQSMGEAFRRMIVENFEWSKAIRLYAESYLNLLRSL